MLPQQHLEMQKRENNMKLVFQRTTLFLAMWLAICFRGQAQEVNISGTSALNLAGTVKLRVAGSNSNLTITDNASINDESTTSLIIEGDLNSEINLMTIDGSLIFNGSVYQYLSAVGNIATLTINNTEGIDVAGPILVNSNLNLSNGLVVTLQDDDLTLNHNVTISGAGSDSFIDGPLRFRVTTALDHTIGFPIGKNDSYKPLRLHFNQVAVTGFYIAEVFESTFPTYDLVGTLQSVSTARYWEVQSEETVTNAYIELPIDSEDGVSDPALARIAKSSNGSWEDLGGLNLTNIPGTIRSSGNFNSFGEFIIASAISNNTEPTISSISPDSGYEGDLITISGSNLGNTNGTINFDDVTATTSDIVSWSDNTIEVKVPIGLSPGTTVNIEITVNGAETPINFTFPFTVKDPSLSCADFNISTFPKNTNPVDNGDNISLTIDVNDASLVEAAAFYYRGISQETWLGPFTPNLNGDEYSYEVNSSTDDIGIEYYFSFSFTDCNTITSNTAYTYIYYPNGVTIPGLTSGDEAGDYDLFSIPLDMDAPSVSSVLDELGSFDKTKWRLFRVQSGNYQEYNSFTSLEPGRGYLLLFTQQNVTSFNSGAGITVPVTKEDPFVMSLQQGWNMISTPYPFTISWEDVLTDNGLDNSLEDFRVYTSTGYQAGDGLLDPFDGAIWFAETASNVDISVIKDNTINGRIAANKKVNNPLDNENWQVNLTLTNQNGYTANGGFGMQTEAEESKDAYDAMLPPKFAGTSDFFFNHQEYFYPYFAKDIVSSNDNYEWRFEVNPANGDALVTLEWENDYFGENSKSLYLYDEATGFAIDMRNETVYTFDVQKSKHFKVIFGDKKDLSFIEPIIGEVYPNPANENLFIPFSLPPEHNKSLLNISLYDLSGKQSGTINKQNLPSGYQRYNLNENGLVDKLSKGMYALQVVLECDGKTINKSYKIMID